MPFRCKCGRTFEKTDTFATHTSSCAPFHHRRMSDTTQLSSANNNNSTSIPSRSPQRIPMLNTSSLPRGLFTTLSPTSATSSLGSPTADSATMMDGRKQQQRELSSSVPVTNSFFMPTALSIQNAFEGARRRSMSSGSSSFK
ncbi:hypothetical protein BDF20DRAFT_868283 [Mycotypha africana]|uniref:uncharacterized protein n=1 Tax=Mycotypha africana TaxID=64632 RepID=UPI0023010579|nr:uncharacterized protein BDF20DRAFT_868283 [Mycotypha africana]KAI8979217.1 hypothetical protein BDF20DRAFT_868283 [Mycotypha africana]